MNPFPVICLILCTYILETKSASLQEAISSAVTECAKANNVNEKEMRKIMDHPPLPEDNKNFTKFFTCFWKALNIEMKDGTINWTTLEQFFGRTINNRPEAKQLGISEEGVKQIAKAATSACKIESNGKSIIHIRNCLFLEGLRQAIKALVKPL